MSVDAGDIMEFTEQTAASSVSQETVNRLGSHQDILKMEKVHFLTLKELDDTCFFNNKSSPSLFTFLELYSLPSLTD